MHQAWGDCSFVFVRFVYYYRRVAIGREMIWEREMEAGEEHGSYPVVKATVGHGVVGDGRGSVSGWRERKEV